MHCLLLLWFWNFDETLPIQGNFKYTGHFSWLNACSAAKLANFWLMQESRTFVGYPFSMSRYFILSSSGPNLVLEQIISALWTKVLIRLIVLICPLQQSCNTQSVLCKDTVTTPPMKTKTYIGLTEGPCNQQYSQHKLSFNNHKYKTNNPIKLNLEHKKTNRNSTRSFLVHLKAHPSLQTTPGNEIYFVS